MEKGLPLLSVLADLILATLIMLTLGITVNKAVLFHGVRLFGDTGGSQYEVKFTVKTQE